MFILNTAYNASRVAIGLFNAVIVISNAFIAATTTTATVATGALAILRTALLFSGIGAGIVILGLVADALFNISGNARKAGDSVNIYKDSVTGVATTTSGYIQQEVTQVDGIKNAWKNADTAAKEYKGSVAAIDLTKIPRTAAANRPLKGKGGKDAFAIQDIEQGMLPNLKGGAREKSYTQTLNAAVKTEKLFTKLTTKKGVSEGLAADLLGGSKGLAQAKKIAKGNTDLADKLQKKFNKTAAGKAEIQAGIDRATAQSEANESAAQAEREARLAEEKAALDERERIYKSFSDSVASTFSNIKNSIMGAFSLPELGGSSDSIIRNMKKLIDATRNFSRNITQLASLGLSPELLQQVITAGPMAGGRLAEALVSGGAGAIAEISAGFSEFGGLAGQIATTGTNAAFMTPTQQSIYNITVSGGVGSGASIGGAIVEAIKAYERTSGAVWQGA
jgi:hypothetical protein